MRVVWEAEDGYWSDRRRSQTTMIPDEEILDCESEQEVVDLVDEYVDNDFHARIYPVVGNMDEARELWASRE